MTYKPEPDRQPAGELTPALRAMMLEWQRSDLMRVNAIRALLGLPPVRAVRDRDAKEDGDG